jgi:hypothetical protein
LLNPTKKIPGYATVGTPGYRGTTVGNRCTRPPRPPSSSSRIGASAHQTACHLWSVSAVLASLPNVYPPHQTATGQPQTCSCISWLTKTAPYAVKGRHGGVEGARKSLMAPEPVSGSQECLLHTCRTGAIRMTSLPLFAHHRSEGFTAVNTRPIGIRHLASEQRLPALTWRRRWYSAALRALLPDAAR